ncbi:cytochrome P450 71A1-like [Aristolochia californica]|uniref:cytochrome P450 71A1-like n=1 Tax=Aristolochia californica TaxID=171875 RepID=UPI0035DD042F
MELFSLNPWLHFLIILLPVFFLREIIIKRTKSYRLPPGPPQLPIIGNLHQIRNFTHRSLWLLSKKHGSLMYFNFGRLPTVVVSSATMAREVMKTHDLEFCSRPARLAYKIFTYNLLDVSFSPYGRYWREMRKICILELFSAKRVESFRFIRDEEVAKMIHSLSTPSSSSSSRAFNLSEMLVSLPYNIVCRAAFGKSYHEENRHEKSRLHRAIKEVEIMLGAFCFSDFWPWLWWFDVLTGIRGRLEKSFSVLDSFFDKVIQEHTDSSGPKPEQEDFIDVLLRVQKDLHLTQNHVKAIIMDVLVAGTSTSSVTALWAMAELIRNPPAMEKVQSEVRRVVRRKRKVDESDVRHLDYLKSVLKETLRLHPPVPLLLPRESIQHCKINGYDIPAKTTVFINSFAIGQHPESWENPEIFHPERFDNEPIDYKGQDFQLVPFGSGRRGCPGIYFGMVTVELALANLLYCFEWELPVGMSRDEIDMSESSGFVVSKKIPLFLVPVNVSDKKLIEVQD